MVLKMIAIITVIVGPTNNNGKKNGECCHNNDKNDRDY
jgi:hypothetical protein